jgi:hypothetical protein
VSASAATAGTNINIGDLFNGAGSKPVAGFSPTFPLAAGYNGRISQPIDLASNPMGPWQQGLYSGAFATYSAADKNNFNSGPYPQLCWVGGLACGFPNADANTDLALGSEVVSVSAGGVVTLGVLTNLSSAEKAAIAGTAAIGTGFPASVNCLSGAINTGAYALGGPRAFSSRVALPSDYAQGGRWFGAWELPVPQAWPPELDNLEAVVINGQLAFTSSIHDASVSGGSNTVVWPLPAGLTPTSPIVITRVTYGDVTAVYAGATLATSRCVAKWPTPADVAAMKFQYILDYGIGAPGSWGGSLPAGQQPQPVTVDQIQALIMPTVYPGPPTPTPPTPTPTPVPVPTPTPTPVPTPTPTPITITPAQLAAMQQALAQAQVQLGDAQAAVILAESDITTVQTILNSLP